MFQDAEQSFLMELSDSALRLKRKEEGFNARCHVLTLESVAGFSSERLVWDERGQRK